MAGWRSRDSSSVDAVRAGRSIASFAKAEKYETLRELIGWFCRASLLVVDDIGYLPKVRGGNLSLLLVNARYEEGAMILSSNPDFAELARSLATRHATALLDSLLHPAVVI